MPPEERLALIKKTQKSNKWAKREPVEQPTPVETHAQLRTSGQNSFERGEFHSSEFNFEKWKPSHNYAENRIIHKVSTKEGSKMTSVEKPSTKLGQNLNSIMESQILRPKEQAIQKLTGP
ncbi:hypothetical protein K7432_017853, partial [Basidiobolus ranarum]